MAIFKKLTTDTGPIYVNLEHVRSIERFDGRTMINFSMGEGVHVEESPKDIMAPSRPTASEE